MKAEIQQDIETLLQDAITAGRYRSIDQFVDAAIREKLTLDQAVDAHYVDLAQQAIDAGGFEERDADWRKKIESLAASWRTA